MSYGAKRASEMSDLERFVSSNPLFYDLPDEVIKGIAPRFTPRTFRPGEIIVHQSDPGDSFYLIRGGHVEVVVTQDAQDLVKAVMEPGEGFGEMALLANQPRNATVRAQDEVEALRLSRDDFTDLIREFPDLMRTMNALCESRVSLLDDNAVAQAENVLAKFRAGRKVTLDYSTMDLVARLNLAAGGQAQADHCKETANLAQAMSKMLCPMVSDQIYAAGCLHEIGKIALGEDLVIRERTGLPLTGEEQAQVDKMYATALAVLGPMASMHDEITFLEAMGRRDFREMPMEAQILRVANDYQEFINPAYRGLPEAEAWTRMASGAGTLYNPKILTALERTIQKFKEMGAEQQIAFIRVMNLALDAKDRYTMAHSKHTGFMAMRVAERLKLGKRLLDTLQLGCELHDVGKIWIPIAILNAPRQLTDAEFEVMKRHPAESGNFFAVIPGMEEMSSIIRAHQEKWNGTGYPDALRGEEIPYLARIMTLGDVFSALITRRPYKEPFPLDKTLAIMSEMNDHGHFDPALFEVFRTITTEMITQKQAVPSV